MVSGTWKASEILTLVRRCARTHQPPLGLRVLRTRGSHHLYGIFDGEREVARFILVVHGGTDVSWTVARSIERACEGQFGKGWLS
jgi:predicted RNA binding protein YcfA (HicA-like mRNA interferase family)